MENVQRTVYASYIQTCKQLGISIQYLPYTTLNEALGIQNDYVYPTNTNPILKYLVIGNGGASFQQNAQGIDQPVPIQHQATDANLYSMIPLVLRTLTNDLSATEMAAYRLRSIITINSVQYVAYYGFLLNLSSTVVDMFTVITSNGTSTSTPFVPNSSNLAPSAQNLASLNVNTVSADYVNVSALIQLIFTTQQIEDIINACNILYGSPYSAIISEMGLCSGYDVDVSGTSNGNQITYAEAVGVQINAFVNTFYAMYYSQNGLNVTYDVGATEPLMLLQSTAV